MLSLNSTVSCGTMPKAARRDCCVTSRMSWPSILMRPALTSVHDVVDALALIRAGKPVNFNGAGSVCDFAPNGDQLMRGMGHWITKGGKNVFIEYARP